MMSWSAPGCVVFAFFLYFYYFITLTTDKAHACKIQRRIQLNFPQLKLTRKCSQTDQPLVNLFLSLIKPVKFAAMQKKKNKIKQH
mgnify:CR=1 FL=1